MKANHMITFIIFVILIFLLPFAVYGLSAAPFVPTAKKDFERISKLAGVIGEKKLTFIELGCGSGRVLFNFAKRFSDLNIIGVEMNPFLFFIAKLKASDPSLKSIVTIKLSSLYTTDLQSADIIYFYLMPKVMSKIRLKLEQEIKSGTKIISYAFPIPDWTPKKISKAEKRLPIYLYEKE